VFYAAGARRGRDFDEVNPQLIEAVKAFQWALQDTTYFSSNTGLSFPAWIVSGLGVLLALANTHFWSKLDRGTAKLAGATAGATFVSFIVAVATLRGTVEKITTRLPGSTAPQRPWTGVDTRPLTYICVSLVGIALFGMLSSASAALIIFGFLVINGFFFHPLQGLTPVGRKVLAQVSDYHKFLSEVDADCISRLHVSDHVPAQLRPEDAYAVAFHRSWLGRTVRDFHHRSRRTRGHFQTRDVMDHYIPLKSLDRFLLVTNYGS
jgi:hypothetical protein